MLQMLMPRQQNLLSYNFARIPSCLKYAKRSGVMSLTDAHLPFKSAFDSWSNGSKSINKPGQPHGHGKFFLEHLYSEFDALLAIILQTSVITSRMTSYNISYRETPDRYSADKHMIGTERDRLENVGTLAHPTIHRDLDLSLGERCADAKRV